MMLTKMTRSKIQSFITYIILGIFIKIRVTNNSIIFQSNTFKFKDGSVVPNIGLLPVHDEDAESLTAVSIDMGYKLIVMSAVTSSHKAIGKALRRVFEKGNIKREDLIIAYKLWNTQHRPELVVEGIMQALKDLGLDYLDIGMLHYPTAWKPDLTGIYGTAEEDFEVSLEQTYKALESLIPQKLIRRIGLSNFNRTQIERIFKIANTKPEVIETEINIYNYNEEFIQFCQERGMLVFASRPYYSQYFNPRDNITYMPMKDPIVSHHAALLRKTTAQITLRFLHQAKIVPIIRSHDLMALVNYLNVFNAFFLNKTLVQEIKLQNKNLSTLSLPIPSHREYPYREHSHNVHYEKTETK